MGWCAGKKHQNDKNFSPWNHHLGGLGLGDGLGDGLTFVTKSFFYGFPKTK